MSFLYILFRFGSNESNTCPNKEEPFVQVSEDDNGVMSVEVMGDMPKVIGYEKESTIQVQCDLYHITMLKIVL